MFGYGSVECSCCDQQEQTFFTLFNRTQNFLEKIWYNSVV